MTKPTLTTPQLLELTGMSRRQLQSFEEAGALRPLRRPRGAGRGRAGVWSFMHVVGAAYGKAFLDAGGHPSWAYDVVRWVASQEPERLAAEFAEGRVLPNVFPGGVGWLVVPYLKPGATRKHHLMLAQLDLHKCYERVLRTALELTGGGAEEEKAAGARRRV
jgi:hypothetical protein